jgi:hypothetical protein
MTSSSTDDFTQYGLVVSAELLPMKLQFMTSGQCSTEKAALSRIRVAADMLSETGWIFRTPRIASVAIRHLLTDHAFSYFDSLYSSRRQVIKCPAVECVTQSQHVHIRLLLPFQQFVHPSP